MQYPNLFSLHIATNGIFKSSNLLSLRPAPKVAKEFPGLERVRALAGCLPLESSFLEEFSLGFCIGATSSGRGGRHMGKSHGASARR